MNALFLTLVEEGCLPNTKNFCSPKLRSLSKFLSKIRKWSPRALGLSHGHRLDVSGFSVETAGKELSRIHNECNQLKESVRRERFQQITKFGRQRSKSRFRNWTVESLVWFHKSRTLELRAGELPVSKSMFYSISLLKGLFFRSVCRISK